ncbi:phosphatidylinositol N-acetylglucosaminyltransferase subunit C [Diabrotica undecimpunctata]|uniref:phosphatidylinositol N-acetylglucosaminyltransferase subunit C n=1 Tax=Diabrotica undecimpunctata TaxID=50387 RepID=UPI003B633A12
MSGTSKPPWKKVLYEKQPYPDNYTDKKIFLQDLKKNIDFKEVKFFEAFYGSLIILQEFCNVVTFVLIYFYLLYEWVEPSALLTCTSAVTTLGFVYYLWAFSQDVLSKLGNDIRTIITFVVVGRLFSPVLHTLTDTVSTDSIYTTTFLMMVIHMIFFDYGVGAAIVSNSVSLSTAIFGSICLASRLSTAFNAFVLMTTAIKMFVLLPILYSALKNQTYFLWIYLIVDIYCLIYLSKLALVLYLFTVVLISLICPFLYVYLQNYKETIYGPWDEAVVDDADSIISNL